METFLRLKYRPVLEPANESIAQLWLWRLTFKSYYTFIENGSSLTWVFHMILYIIKLIQVYLCRFLQDHTAYWLM